MTIHPTMKASARYAAPVNATVFDPDGHVASFTISCLGVPLAFLMKVPGHSFPLRFALGRLAEDGYRCSPFGISGR